MDDAEVIWSLKISMPSDVDAASAVIRDLVQQLQQNQWSEKDTFAIHMATEEALMNAVKHGNRHDPNKTVEVDLKISKTCFAAKIADMGDGFDVENVPDPCDDCNLDKTSGRGVSLIRSFVDSVHYNRTGNEIQFSRRKRQPTE